MLDAVFVTPSEKDELYKSMFGTISLYNSIRARFVKSAYSKRGFWFYELISCILVKKLLCFGANTIILNGERLSINCRCHKNMLSMSRSHTRHVAQDIFTRSFLIMYRQLFLAYCESLPSIDFRLTKTFCHFSVCTCLKYDLALAVVVSLA